MRLKDIQNWPERARAAKWSAATLARNCGVSVRTLHLYFLQQAGKNTKAWLAELRLQCAIELMRAGSSIKATSITLGYKNHSSFTRKFKAERGICPTLCNYCGLCLLAMADGQAHSDLKCLQML
jgi:AraC-like DNA-binding protein